MHPMRFVLTPDHVKLLRAMYVGWQDCETGAPEIDPKRPYGNSYVAGDVAEILGWTVDGDDGLTDDQRDKAMEIHFETAMALQVILQTGSFEPGVFVNTDRMAPYGMTYTRLAEAADKEA
jgi:hypothetical protein